MNFEMSNVCFPGFLIPCRKIELKCKTRIAMALSYFMSVAVLRRKNTIINLSQMSCSYVISLVSDDTLDHCWLDSEPASLTLVQHPANAGLSCAANVGQDVVEQQMILLCIHHSPARIVTCSDPWTLYDLSHSAPPHGSRSCHYPQPSLLLRLITPPQFVQQFLKRPSNRGPVICISQTLFLFIYGKIIECAYVFFSFTLCCGFRNRDDPNT